jgi:transaldolase
LDTLSEVGVDLDRATKELEEEGVEKFADSFTALLDTIQEKIHEVQN